MKRLLCDGCALLPNLFGGSQPIHEGTYQLLPESAIGEPAEMIRVVHGTARRPTTEQRLMKINDVPYQLPIDIYTCDRCDRPITQGQSAWCVTVWTERRGEPPPWERGFLDIPK